jgi:hypothetical protein
MLIEKRVNIMAVLPVRVDDVVRARGTNFDYPCGNY